MPTSGSELRIERVDPSTLAATQAAGLLVLNTNRPLVPHMDTYYITYEGLQNPATRTELGELCVRLLTSLFTPDAMKNRRVSLTITVSQYTVYIPPAGTYTADDLQGWAEGVIREAFEVQSRA
jgi:hypothetical protein